MRLTIRFSVKQFPADRSLPPTLEKFYQDVPIQAATLCPVAKTVNPKPRSSNRPSHQRCCRKWRQAINAQNHGPNGKSHAFKPCESPVSAE